jgi:hypothetical protein
MELSFMEETKMNGERLGLIGLGLISFASIGILTGLLDSTSLAVSFLKMGIGLIVAGIIWDKWGEAK